MLPVVVGDARAARAVLVGALLLVAASVLPFAGRMGVLYLVCALAGGGLFIWRSVELVRAPGRLRALSAFRASLVQLMAVLGGAMLEAALA